MEDQAKTKAQLIEELNELRARQREYGFGEPLKESNCLPGTSRLEDREHATLADVSRGSAGLARPSKQYRLQDLIDVAHFQSLQDRLDAICSFPSAIIDNDGQILTATAWQDICTHFHRQHKDTELDCIKSDQYILSHLHESSPAVSYQCPHGLVDNAMPIIIDGVHYGNFFTGQFFLQKPDLSFFREQAAKYGFDEDAYLQAVEKVPVWGQEQLDSYLLFIEELIKVVSAVGLRRLREIEIGEVLRESEARLRLAQNIAGMGDFVWDIATGAITWSDGMHGLLLYDRAEVIDYEKVNADVHHPDDSDRVTKWLMDSISSGEQFLTPNEYRLMRKDGRIIHVQTNGRIEYRDGKAVSLFGTCLDITERKDLEERLRQSERMEAIGQLAGGVAHDFNNMLEVIIGYTELTLEDQALAPSLHAELQEVLKAARRSADLTRQLLTFARKEVISPRVLDLNETIEGTLKMLGRLIGENIDLDWQPKEGLWPVLMDPSQIDQILTNLCVNARDAIGDIGAVKIALENVILDEAGCINHAAPAPGGYMMLSVSDNGCGMDQGTVDHVFEPFFTTKEIGKGTGLGLAAVYGIVQQNAGGASIRSEPGLGTTFEIYLPRHVGAASVVTDGGGAVLRGTETVLVVEDEPSVRRMAKKMLEKQGYSVLTAATPEEATRLVTARTGEIHLLITDVIMPEMNGRDLATSLLQLRPGLRCLFMSGYTADVIAQHGMLDEGVSFIQKPFSSKELGAKVREVLDRSEGR